MESGIYRILNTVTGKCYVGSTKNFKKRWKQHCKTLKNGLHSSIKLQRSYDKHGKNAFTFEILERMPYEKDVIIEAENTYMDLHNSKSNGYNIASASFGDVLTNHPNRDDILRRRSATTIRNNAMLSDEERVARFVRLGERNYNWRPHTHRFCPVCGDRLRPSAKETCGKCRDRSGDKNPFYGKRHSKETIERIKETKRKNPQPLPSNTKKISAEGVVFESCASAARHFGISNGLVTYRIKSDKYDWFYINA